MRIIFSLSLSLLFLLASCKEELPDNNCCDCKAPITENGAGTISFDMDGTTWSPCNTNSKNGTSPRMIASRDTSSGWDWLVIKGSKLINGGNEDIYITIAWPEIGSIPQFNEIYKPHGSLNLELFADNPKYNHFYTCDTLNSFHIEVTRLDLINKIISGVFYGTLVEDDGGIDTSKNQIKNGRFDTHYY